MNNPTQLPQTDQSTGTVPADQLQALAASALAADRLCLVSVSIEDGKPIVLIRDGGYDENAVSVDFGPVAGWAGAISQPETPSCERTGR